MGKIIRRVIAALLAVTAILLICIPGLDAQAVTQRGDYSMDGSTIAGYTGNAADLSIPDTVTAIGKSAFANCDSLVHVTIPDSVKTIDFAAFEDCKNLQSVSIPESVKTIGSSAFSGCESLYSVNIPSRVSSIGSAAFAKCTSLNSISCSADNLYYVCNDGVLYTKNGKKLVQYLAGRTLSTYAMPSSIEEIEEYAFWGANLLTNVTISGKVKKIPEYAFDNCSGLTNVVLPSSITRLEAYSFGDCTNLKSIVIPDSVGYIDDKAFYCSGNVEIQFTDTPVSQTVSMDNAVEETQSGNIISNGAAEETTEAADTYTVQPYTEDYTENILPGELGSGKIVGGSAVLLMSSNMPVRGFAIDEAELEDSIAASGGNTTFSSDEFDIIAGRLVHYGGTETNPAIPSNVTAIGDRVFYKNEQIQGVTLPDDLTELGDFSFARSKLNRIRIPDGTTAIGYAAFYHCNELTDVSIPGSVKTIELGAFEGSLWLNNWKAKADGDNYLIVGDGILLAYKGEGGAVSIPDGVKTISAGCFEGNTAITGVTFAPSVTTIGEDAFNGCVNLVDMQLTDGITAIEDRAFKNTALQNLTIPAGVETIGLGAFDMADNQALLKTVVFAGDRLPDLTSKPTAARLSTQDLRSLAFYGVENAIVNPSCNLESGTILDETEYGFRGQIYTRDMAGHTLELQKITKEPSESTGIVMIDPHAVINGEDYIMTGVQADAFSAYENCEDWSGKRLTGITVDGNASEDLTSLLAGIELASMPGPVIGNMTEDNAITVNLDASGFNAEDCLLASAKIPGNTEIYQLTIKEEESIRAALNLAFYNYYGQVGDITMVPLNISMTDKTGTIPIKKLATGKMEITIPIPTRFQGMQDLKMGALDSNGALEELSTELVTTEGKDCLRFVASHLSPYAVYRIQSPAQVQTGDGVTTEVQVINETLAGNQIGAIAGTLHKRIGTIEAKWFVIVILFSMAAILFLWKDRKRTR